MPNLPDIATFFANLGLSLNVIQYLLSAIAYVAGFMMGFKALYQMRIYGDMRTMSSSQTDLRGPIVMLLVAAALIYMPTMIDTLLKTTFGYDLSGMPLLPTGQTATDKIVHDIGYFAQIVGIVAFIRGWLLLGNVAKQSAPHGSTSKAFTHIIGGLLLINITGTMKMFEATFLGQ